ncbi:MAG: hypothetical protein NVS4B8_23960 [Herpetosiphon sp.]
MNTMANATITTPVDPNAILTINNLKTYFLLEGATVKSVNGVSPIGALV